eukprot:2872924-Prorocentrum_lima.AAC.1
MCGKLCTRGGQQSREKHWPGGNAFASQCRIQWHLNVSVEPHQAPRPCVLQSQGGNLCTVGGVAGASVAVELRPK